MVKLHGVPLSIISDRGTQFTSQFWKSFQKGLGTRVKISMTFHPQTDGQEECTIQTLEDMLRACVIDFKEALYGRRCRSLIGWFEVGKVALIGPDMENLSYDEVLVEIFDWQVKKLRNKEVASVKVLWRNQLVEGAAWEAEANMMS
ncbi:hypothetical protein MTR67_034749 [Solanum verrucosum]|uniref:Integrase catalytic domain-containing protein n=1 Tax=Solanum verrucosum TaxID=315347 RepID=A0AAF0U8X3_SOLVR|nr:hypothetical protein MTR67_034749 [Solanum verrucosum]